MNAADRGVRGAADEIHALANLAAILGVLSAADGENLVIEQHRGDADGTRRFLNDLIDTASCCGRCANYRMPGGVAGYCAHPDAAPRIYALLAALPPDRGRSCHRFEPIRSGDRP